MKPPKNDPIWKMMGLLFKPHPWHGISPGDNAPNQLTVYIEIVPTDSMKYEIDKQSGYLKVDRPQRYSNFCPTLYGLVPQTYCAEKVAELSMEKTGKKNIVGDGDPLDICVLTEKTITQGGILLEVIPIGGLRMIDGNEADDKIIAVMKGDAVYGQMKSVKDVPPNVIDRLRHYFLTYKDVPGDEHHKHCEIDEVYDVETAYEVIKRSQEDYELRFGGIEEMLTSALRG